MEGAPGFQKKVPKFNYASGEGTLEVSCMLGLVVMCFVGCTGLVIINIISENVS